MRVVCSSYVATEEKTHEKQALAERCCRALGSFGGTIGVATWKAGDCSADWGVP